MKKPLDIKTRNGRPYGIFLCGGCSEKFETRMDYIRKMTGLCRSCANIQAGKKRSTHGFNNTNSRLHVTWANMKRRCLSPRNKETKYYYGVVLCEEWMKFEPFMEWALMNGYDDDKTIDRIDPNKGYDPLNCRFVSLSVQSANRKKQDNNTTGYIGVYWGDGAWRSRIVWQGIPIHIGRFRSKKEAALARDKYIIDNDLPHTLNIYKRKFRQQKVKELKRERAA